jgi:hypothetical protein
LIGGPPRARIHGRPRDTEGLGEHGGELGAGVWLRLRRRFWRWFWFNHRHWLRDRLRDYWLWLWQGDRRLLCSWGGNLHHWLNWVRYCLNPRNFGLRVQVGDWFDGLLGSQL